MLGIYTYSYNDSGAWKDQLTGYSFQDYYKNDSFSGTITYDVMGNPLTYFNGKNTWNFTWQYRRQLASATDGTHTITNEYDVDGIRSSKTVDGVKHVRWPSKVKDFWKIKYADVTVPFDFSLEGGKSGC